MRVANKDIQSRNQNNVSGMQSMTAGIHLPVATRSKRGAFVYSGIDEQKQVVQLFWIPPVRGVVNVRL